MMESHYHRDGLIFYVRQRSSDIPIVEEVVGRKVYFGGGFLSVSAHDVVVDVGAHIGTFSVLAASMGAAVISYEPVQANFDLLYKNIDINGFPVAAYHMGILRKSGKRTIYVRDFNYGGSNFYTPNAKGEEVDCTTLADAMDKNGIDHIDFLKLDCEDSELEILESYPHLDRIRQIAIEYVGPERRDTLLKLLTEDWKCFETKVNGIDRMGIILARRTS